MSNENIIDTILKEAKIEYIDEVPEWALHPPDFNEHDKDLSDEEIKDEIIAKIFKDVKFVDKVPEWALHPPDFNELDEDFLEERGFDINETPEEIKEELIKNLKYAEQRLKIGLSFKDIEKEKITGTIRSKLEDEEIDKIKDLIQNNAIKLEKEVIYIPNPNEFKINTDVESDKWLFTHIALDTEADHHSELILSQVFNLEARRLVLCLLDNEYSITVYEQPDRSQIIYMKSPNLSDSIIIADIETVIASVLISAMQQGHKKVSELFTELQENNKLPPIRYELLHELLYDKRKSLYLVHNASYDIEQLKTNHNNAKRVLYSFHTSKPQRLKINNIFSEDVYYYHLGNRPAGFRFSLSAQKKGVHKKCSIKISPAQKESYPLTWLCDTMILARSLQQKKASLEYLSAGTKYEKVKEETAEKIFSKEKIVDITKEEINKTTLYAIFDVLATISVYEKLTNKIDFEKLNNILGITIEKTNAPFTSKIISTATISKHIILNYISQKTRLDKYTIQDNIKKSRKFQQNFLTTYLGGKVEVFSHGLIKSTPKQKITYLDFASLYPHTAWICEAEFLYLTCAKNELHKYIKNNTKKAINRIKQSINEILESITQNIPLQKITFQRLIGNCTIHSTIPLQLPRRHKGRRTEILCTGRITTTLADLTVALVREIIINKTPLYKLFNKISFIQCEYIDFPINSSYGKEIFTKLYLQRKKIKEQLAKLKETHANTNEINKLESAQLFMKILMNSGYGVSGEGISLEDHTGILFNPIIANGITSIARVFTSIAEIKTRYENALCIYTDTDSIIIRATKLQKKNLLSIFKKIIELKDEIEDEYHDENKHISKIYVAGKKKYGYILNDETIKFKKHGRAQYEKEKFEKALEEAYRYIFTTKFNILTTTEAGKIATKYHSYLQEIHLDTQKSSIFKGLTKFNKKTIITYEWNYKGIPIYVKYHLTDDNYLVTNTRKISKGIFGKYLNIGRGKHKIIFFITIPIDVEDLILQFIETFYFEDMDIIFKKQKKKDKWQEFYDYIYHCYMQYAKNEGTDFDKEDILKYFRYYFVKLCIAYNIDPIECIEKEGLPIFERIADYNNLEIIFRQIAPQKLAWYFSYETPNFIEEKMIDHYTKDFLNYDHPAYQIYNNILTQIKKKETIETILEDIKEKKISEFQGLEDRIKELIKTIEKKEHIKKRMEKYFQFDRTKIKREIDEYHETFKTTKCFTQESKDNIIKNISTNLNQILETDGFSYFISIPIPNLQFSSELKTNIDLYYSRNVLNTSISASKIYFATHGKKQFRITEEKYAVCNYENDELYNKIIYADKTTLPCPKANRYILIPLLFQSKPVLHTNKNNELWITKQQYNTLPPDAQEYLLKHNIIKQHNSSYTITDPEKYSKFEERQYKHEWQELFIGNNRFSVSIEKYQSTNYNALLLINIIPEKQGYHKRRNITATLRINPLSFNLINLNLYKTTINELLETEKEIIKLLKPLLIDPDMHAFTRNQSLTINDAKKKITFYRNLTYQFLTKEIIKKSLKKASIKLTELTISKQRKIKTNIDLFMSILQSQIIKKYHQSEKTLTAREILKRQKILHVYPHKASRGISLNNVEEKYAISIYAKDHRWLQSKVTRMGEKRNLTEAQMKKILQTKLQPNLIRYEQALFGIDAILKLNYLNQIEQMLIKAEKIIKPIIISPHFTNAYTQLETIILPNYYCEKIEGIPPPTFNAL